VTAMSCASSSFKISQKEKQNKRNAKSNKIDKRKEKLLMFKAFYNKLLPLILNKARFDQKVLTFFRNYLVNRKTKYL